MDGGNIVQMNQKKKGQGAKAGQHRRQQPPDQDVEKGPPADGADTLDDTDANTDPTTA